MMRPTRQPGFMHGVIVAAALAFIASALVALLTPFVGLGLVIRVLIPALGLAYLLHLLSRSQKRTGRVTAITLWFVLALLTWWLTPPLPLYLLIHVAAIWLLRSLYFYSSLIPAVMDMGLSILSLATAVLTISHSGSVFLATWSFFLVQALCSAIPTMFRGKHKTVHYPAKDAEGFERAKRQADAALRQLFTQ